jgi:hypothetical protein
MELKTNIFLYKIIVVSSMIVQKHYSKTSKDKIFHKNHLSCTTSAPKKHIVNLKPIRKNDP